MKVEHGLCPAPQAHLTSNGSTPTPGFRGMAAMGYSPQTKTFGWESIALR